MREAFAESDLIRKMFSFSSKSILGSVAMFALTFCAGIYLARFDGNGKEATGGSSWFGGTSSEKSLQSEIEALRERNAQLERRVEELERRLESVDSVEPRTPQAGRDNVRRPQTQQLGQSAF